MSMLGVENVHFSYGYKEVLKNIAFSLSGREVCVVLGPNGSGKTTLLKCLNRLIRPQKGNVIVENNPIDTLSNRNLAKKISYLPQDNKISFLYSVLDIVLMGRNPYIGALKKPSPGDLNIAKQAINTVGIQHLEHRQYAVLSGGEKKLVMIARSLAQNAKILILDEPTNHLDFKNQFITLNKVKCLAKKNNLSIVMSLHDPNLAFVFADKVIMMKNGEIIAYGQKEEVINEKNLSILYEINMDILETNGKRIIIPHIDNL